MRWGCRHLGSCDGGPLGQTTKAYAVAGTPAGTRTDCRPEGCSQRPEACSRTWQGHSGLLHSGELASLCHGPEGTWLGLLRSRISTAAAWFGWLSGQPSMLMSYPSSTTIRHRLWGDLHRALLVTEGASLCVVAWILNK